MGLNLEPGMPLVPNASLRHPGKFVGWVLVEVWGPTIGQRLDYEIQLGPHVEEQSSAGGGLDSDERQNALRSLMRHAAAALAEAKDVYDTPELGTTPR